MKNKMLPDRYNYLILFLSGVFFGISITVKQNYIIYCSLTFLVFIFIYRTEIFSPKLFKSNLKTALFFSIGFSFLLLQFILTYANSGYFWLYDLNTVEATGIKLARMQPHLEMVAYSLPHFNAYLTSLTEPINTFSFCILKLYLGLSKIYLPIYHGYAPMKPIYIFNLHAKLHSTIFFIFYCLFTFLTYKTIKSKSCKVLILSGFLIALSVAIATHTENRYYLLPRMVLLFSILEYGRYWFEKLKNQALGSELQ